MSGEAESSFVAEASAVAAARPVAAVWEALTVPERLADWLGRPADLDLRVGGRYFVRFAGAPNDDGVYGVRAQGDQLFERLLCQGAPRIAAGLNLGDEPVGAVVGE